MEDGLKMALAQVGDYLGEYLPYGQLDSLWQQVKDGEVAPDWQLLLTLAGEVFAREWTSALLLFSQLLAVAVMAVMLSRFNEGSVGKLAGLVVGVAAALPAVRAMQLAGREAEEAVLLMSDFLYALLPVLLMLLASMGGASAVALFNPALLAAVAVCLHMLRWFVLPMLYISGALGIGNRLSFGIKIGGLAKLTRDIAAGVFGIMLGVFTGLLGVVGLSSSVVAGLGYRTLKNAGGMFIPVVGRSLADALDSVVGTTLLLKNMIGLAGIVVLLAVCIVPGIKLLLMYLAFRFAGALAEPLGDGNLSGMLNDMSQVVVMFFAVVAAAGLFFFFLISITICMGNVMLAIR